MFFKCLKLNTKKQKLDEKWKKGCHVAFAVVVLPINLTQVTIVGVPRQNSMTP